MEYSKQLLNEKDFDKEDQTINKYGYQKPQMSRNIRNKIEFGLY